jgi:hypothetical protein
LIYRTRGDNGFDFDFLVFSATFSNISAISWRPVLVVEEAGVPGENHRPWASNNEVKRVTQSVASDKTPGKFRSSTM